MSSWHCPYCNQIATLVKENIDVSSHIFNVRDNIYHALKTEVVRCPNDKCREHTIEAYLFHTTWSNNYRVADQARGYFNHWKLKPQSSAKPLPEYIPKAIRDDYTEACLIVDLSPKASATLARRCLQGMIRDFFKVSGKTLWAEIQALKDKIDPTTWKAIDGLRNIGNIGAHMEANIDLVVDVDPDEASLLIQLIETLIDEWYVHRHERAERMSKIITVAEEKKMEKESGKALKDEATARTLLTEGS